MRKLAYFAFAFVGAILLAVYVLPEAFLPWAALVCALPALFFAVFFRERVRLRAILLCGGLMAGFLYNWGYTALFYAPSQALAGRTCPVETTALDYAEETARGFCVDVELEGYRARLYLNEGTNGDIRPGDKLALEVSLHPAEGPDGEDLDYFKSLGIYLLAYQEGELLQTRPERLPLRFCFVAAKRAVSEELGTLFPPDAAPFAQALAVGDKSGVYGAEAVLSVLNLSGVRHVIAISGMHLSFLVGMVRRLGGRRRRTAILCIPVILGFMALTGFSVSVVRAGIMQILLLAAALFRREEDPPTALSLAAMLILLMNPYAAQSASFQLSFGAMAGILFFSGGLFSSLDGKLHKGRFTGRLYKIPGLRQVPRFVAATLSSSLGAMVFTVPLMALNFGYVSIIAPLTNVLTLWAVSLAFLLSLAAGLLGLLWTPLGLGLAWCAVWPIRYVLLVARCLAGLPFAALFTGNRYAVFFFIYAYALLAVSLTQRKKEKGLVLPACLLVLGLGLTLLLSNLHFTRADMTFTALDVGQGQSIVLTSGGLNAVIDCGGSGENAGNSAADFLASMGVTQVDALILTHWHADHANGVEQLLARMEVKRFIIPYAADDSDGYAEKLTKLAAGEAEILYVTEPLNLTLGAAVLTIYPPIGSSDENERGLAVLCSAGDYDALVTGDMGEEIERRLLERYALPDIELLMVGHHGSKYATCQALLDVTRPETAFISVGENSYGHPTVEVLERLETAGVEVYRTDLHGNITVRVG